MNRSAARLGSRVLGVGISTALLSALLLVASAHMTLAGGLPGTTRATTFAELPNELQGAVRLAHEGALVDPAQYVVQANESTSPTAHNPVQQFALRFGAGQVGVMPVAAEQSQWEMGLQLARYGRAGQLTPVADAAPTITGNRVEYRRGALVEWYVNEDRGVEQVFVIASRPAGRRGALELEMDVTGLRPELVDSGRVALRATHGEQVLTYGELRVSDARGLELPAHLEVAKGSGDRASVRLLVDDAAAAYPVTVDPLIVSQQAELTASDGAADDGFGFSAALSSDGSTALIGAEGKTVSGNTGQGAAYVFVRSGTTWTQRAELTGSDGTTFDSFGRSAALSSDGNTALIGAYGKTVSGNTGQGAAYVFVRSGTTWTQQAELTASDGTTYGGGFGESAALSSDGNTALIGAYGGQGAAYVFVRSGTTWTQQAELTASDGTADDSFGRSAALSSDGSTALIGAYDKTVSGNTFQGAAYVFVRSGTTWTQQAELTASARTGDDNFGSSAALSSDGSTALIGAYAEGSIDGGAAYVFVRSGATWMQQAELTASDGTGDDSFGRSAALSSDGSTALIGANGKAVSGTFQGAAYVFVRSGTTWMQQAELTASDGAAHDSFGRSAALSSDGSTALIGADGKTLSGNTFRGAAYVFDVEQVSQPSSILPSAITATDTCIPVSDTSIFSPTGGCALIGTELISYTGLGTSCGGAPAARASAGTAAAAGVLTGVTRNLNGQGGAHAGGTTVTPTAAPCVGDCNSDGQVTVDEILTMVNIALGYAPVTTCEAGDANDDGQITVDEILTAVNHALNGCGG